MGWRREPEIRLGPPRCPLLFVTASVLVTTILLRLAIGAIGFGLAISALVVFGTLVAVLVVRSTKRQLRVTPTGLQYHGARIEWRDVVSIAPPGENGEVVLALRCALPEPLAERTSWACRTFGIAEPALVLFGDDFEAGVHGLYFTLSAVFADARRSAPERSYAVGSG